jgi:hypothetical protein
MEQQISARRLAACVPFFVENKSIFCFFQCPGNAPSIRPFLIPTKLYYIPNFIISIINMVYAFPPDKSEPNALDEKQKYAKMVPIP